MRWVTKIQIINKYANILNCQCFYDSKMLFFLYGKMEAREPNAVCNKYFFHISYYILPFELTFNVWKYSKVMSFTSLLTWTQTRDLSLTITYTQLKLQFRSDEYEGSHHTVLPDSGRDILLLEESIIKIFRPYIVMSKR